MNYKNTFFQFLAGLFLMLGIKQFFIFADLNLLELISSLGKENFAYFADKSDRLGVVNKLQGLINAKIILGFIAILINYIILFILAYKRKLNWNISIVITVILGILHYFNILQLSPISFVKINLVAAYLIPAFVVFILSVLFYYLSFKTSRN
jgi:hypothetical protein